ncbi:MAG: cobaltochelatase subunit CobN [Deltaproteobacteria bacterium]|jgi:cobaltochelatase CobN|nr:cobaltochelatase subunit CobN [Deltaproteobacteria bacterium]
MKITALLGSVYASYLINARPEEVHPDVPVSVFVGRKAVAQKENVRKAISESGLIFIQDSGEQIYDTYKSDLEALPSEVKIIRLGHDMSDWGGNVGPQALAQASLYLSQGGPVNGANLWRYLIQLALGAPEEAPGPAELPRLGLWHPEAPELSYPNIREYLAWYEPYARTRGLGPAAGLLVNRFFWAIAKPTVEAAMIEALEALKLSVFPVFAGWSEGPGEEPKAGPWILEQYGGRSGPKVEAVVKFVSHFSNEGQDIKPAFIGDDSPARANVRLFKALNAPVFQPLVSWSQSPEQWENNPRGMGAEAAWTMTLTEFEGVIEPFFVGGTVRGADDSEDSCRQAHPERIARLAGRIARWIDLRRTPPRDRKIAFVLHSNPCASVEATVGTASGLDAAESVVRIGREMKKAGYRLEVPESGEKLMETIMAKKAISEFRWTSAPEIVESGGALALLPLDSYARWYETFPEKIKDQLEAAWGRPPGETIDEVPPSMVYGDKIIVSGLPLGPNCVITVQPKRGCAGSRCDGRVCRILQDPLIPPPHQYLAVYRWLEDPLGFGAQAVIHVGTHGSLEYLPGKGAGLSAECLPDLAIHELPNLYIFAAGATGDGLTAKRRSYAALVDHMPPGLKGTELYGPWAEISDLLTQRTRAQDRGRREQLEDFIRQKARTLGFDNLPADGEFEELSYALRQDLALISQSQTEDGLHILGEIPEKEKLARMIATILRFESGEAVSFRSWLAGEMGFDFEKILNDPGAADSGSGLSGFEILAKVDGEVIKIVTSVLDSGNISGDLAAAAEKSLGRKPGDGEFITQLAGRLKDILERAGASRELDSLMNAQAGGYITPGPSAALWRGRADVLPTGRNFYTQDPRRLPTQAALKVGSSLAEATVAKHLKEEGRCPESVAFFWISSDLLQNDGEDLAQMLYLMGLKPRYSGSGLLIGTEVIPLEELGRPRIDLTVRISGIMRDAFSGTVDQLDRAVLKAAGLDEPVEKNFVRKHTLENLAASKADPRSQEAFRRATYRIFASPPGSCLSGVYLAVMASAWRDKEDLKDIYLQHGSYAYGEGVFGELAPRAFQAALSRVDVNFLKLNSDSDDFLGCGGYFGTQGGLALACEAIQNRPVKNYCGDARNAKALKVRDLTEEISRSAATRLLNPAWIAGQKNHGYKGAQEIARRVGNAYGWQATAKAVDEGIFDGITETFFLNEENRAFFEKHNPYALEEMGRRLLEAASRELWQPDGELLDKLKSVYLSLEGLLEERTETFGGDIQGGAVDILTASEVASWKEKMDAFKAQAAAAGA